MSLKLLRLLIKYVLGLQTLGREGSLSVLKFEIVEFSLFSFLADIIVSFLSYKSRLASDFSSLFLSFPMLKLDYT
jgi:hypothetical protein